MPLSEPQIERYSRQIIVPGMGGRSQERLLATRMLLVAAFEDAREPLAYLAGAGVGTIFLQLAVDSDATDGLCADMLALNPDAVVSARRDPVENIDLVLTLADGASVLELIRQLTAAETGRPGVFARLDSPASVAVLPDPPPCVRCAGEELLAPFGTRVENAAFVAMAATAEAFKIVAGYTPCSGPSIIKFDGYETRTRALSRTGASTRCACARK